MCRPPTGAYLPGVVIASDRLSELPFFQGMPARALERLAEAAAERVERPSSSSPPAHDDSAERGASAAD
jgi:hypothetical protein